MVVRSGRRGRPLRGEPRARRARPHLRRNARPGLLRVRGGDRVPARRRPLRGEHGGGGAPCRSRRLTRPARRVGHAGIPAGAHPQAQPPALGRARRPAFGTRRPPSGRAARNRPAPLPRARPRAATPGAPLGSARHPDAGNPPRRLHPCERALSEPRRRGRQASHRLGGLLKTTLQHPPETRELTMEQKRELLERLLASRSQSARRFPLSSAQRRLWFLAELDPSDPAYNLLNAYRLLGRLDTTALAASLAEIVRRQGALRTTFVFDGKEPEQIVAPSGTASLHRIDLRALDPVRRWREAQRVASAAARVPYDLAQGPLHRFFLLSLAEEESVLLVAMHHIIGDIWSFKVINQELKALYEAAADGRPTPLPPLA